MHPGDDQAYGLRPDGVWVPVPKEVADAQHIEQVCDRADRFQNTLNEIRALPETGEQHGTHH